MRYLWVGIFKVNYFFNDTHSFFLFNFDVKRKKEPVSPKKKRKARFLQKACFLLTFSAMRKSKTPEKAENLKTLYLAKITEKAAAFLIQRR